jgi:hypothetical protein
VTGQGRKGERYFGASELGEFAFCNVSWKLASVGVARGRGGKRREVGRKWHRNQGRRISFSRSLRIGGVVLILLAVVFIILLILFGRYV